MRVPGSKTEPEPVPAPTADFANSENKGLQMGQNYGHMEASFYSDAIQGINIAAGASVYMGEQKTVEDKLLDALIGRDPEDRKDLRDAEPGTCEWLLDSAPFQQWIEKNPAETGPLYVAGIPGSGKSVLLKFLAKEVARPKRVGSPGSSPVERPLLSLGPTGKTMAAACFCDDRNDHRQTPIWILRTLMYRLFNQDRSLVKHLQKHIQKVEDLDATGSDPAEFQSKDVLQKILEELIPDPKVEVVYFIVDGLDQCGQYQNDVVFLIKELTESINDEAVKQGEQFSLRFIISDRGSSIVRNVLRPEYIIDMPTGNQPDIEQVTDKSLKCIQEYRGFSDSILHFTTSLLKENSKGMFMWLSLILGDLRSWDGTWSERKIEHKLHSIPLDVAAFYKAMLETQSLDCRLKLQSLLMWVYLAGRPLALEELNVVLQLQEKGKSVGARSSEDDVDQLRRDIESKWGALLEVHDGFVHLSHQSVKDFLSGVFSVEGEKEYPKYGLAPEEAHRRIASACIAYLQIQEVHRREVPKPPVDKSGMIDETRLQEVRDKYLEGLPLLQYAVVFVGHHLQKGNIQKETDVEGMKSFFAIDSAALASWSPAYDLLKRYTSGKCKWFSVSSSLEIPAYMLLTDSGHSSSTSHLFVAARLNLPWLAERSPTWATYTSLPSHVWAPDLSGWSAIHIAADSESVEMVDWLLSKGAFVGATTVGLPHPGRTALHLAASKSSENGPKMVRLLLDARADPGTATRRGKNTPLHYAIDGRSVETVKALLEKGADPSVANSSGVTPLHKCAAIPGLEDIMQVLLEHGADPNKKASIGAVSAVRGLSSLKNTRDLWQSYYTINTGHTALHIATEAKNTEQTVKILLENGAEPNSRDSAGRSPLHIAVVKMQPEAMTKMLIEHGSDPNAQDSYGKTPLSMLLTTFALQAEQQPEMFKTIQGSRERMIEILLSAGADPRAEGKDKLTPITLAEQANLQWAVGLMNGKQQNGDDHGHANETSGWGEHAEHAEHAAEAAKGMLEREASRWLPKRLF
ncbi:hypothetical protein CBS76997_9228 [Aspergillus niger]|nr:hypothetical protein CBS13152_3248 [Aspergillus niger]KAI2964071.1 hypothetical protein CBS147323_6565 [Aspergillus niger]KAI3016356.1 hypothetical protein CBS147347_10802 [Aspergillus niger]KAI3037342.1 hypothetical protein CBS76997_9228 [Aspergillus niger]KAI3060925.1 hypothetical protein CBS147353_10142 [Aspergillus niger]